MQFSIKKEKKKKIILEPDYRVATNTCCTIKKSVVWRFQHHIRHCLATMVHLSHAPLDDRKTLLPDSVCVYPSVLYLLVYPVLIHVSILILILAEFYFILQTKLRKKSWGIKIKKVHELIPWLCKSVPDFGKKKEKMNISWCYRFMLMEL